uniref:Uncharacterized protein n=1 Tax=Lepeophtheirus salmonis TaxID=72036 RepID=A0A0K2T1V4_LEPSM
MSSSTMISRSFCTSFHIAEIVVPTKFAFSYVYVLCISSA